MSKLNFIENNYELSYKNEMNITIPEKRSRGRPKGIMNYKYNKNTEIDDYHCETKINLLSVPVGRPIKNIKKSQRENRERWGKEQFYCNTCNKFIQKRIKKQHSRTNIHINNKNN